MSNDEMEARKDGYTPVKKNPPFMVWDMPSEIAKQLQEYANRHTGKKCWAAIKHLLEREIIFNRIIRIEERLKELEERKDE